MASNHFEKEPLTFIAVPSGMFKSILKELEDTNGEREAGRILFHAGFRLGIELIERTGTVCEKTSDLPKVLLDLWADMGFGRLSIEKFSEIGLTIHCYESAEALAIGKADKPSCNFTRGCLVGILFTLTTDAYYCTETQCIAEGKEYCIYQLGLTKAEKVPVENCEVWFTKGTALLEDGKYVRALKCFNKALEYDISNAEAWNYRGVALYNLRRFAEAIESFDKTLSLVKNHAEAWCFKGVALYNLGKLNESLVCFEQATKIMPTYADALYYKGINLFDLQDYKAALECFEHTLKLRPNLISAVEYKRKCLANIEQKTT